jgi:hypothetical protein
MGQSRPFSSVVRKNDVFFKSEKVLRVELAQQPELPAGPRRVASATRPA